MGRIRKLTPLVPRSDGRTVQPPPKRADPALLTPQHKAWAERVCSRAGWRCEKIENGQRCERSRATGHRMVADHIIERADGGALYDDANGQCLCVSHNTSKGLAARAARR
ncbi:HNH endonuclease [Bradyrhizobium sp. HKCCYLRH3099]|uniref:HNH endonuclease n=1 Tax=unclassified Bradyrhizobium TaxID=2631580 RepID=UPI003EBE3625